MRVFPVIALAGVIAASPCTAQIPVIGPTMSAAEIISLTEQLRPQLEVVEQYQKQLNDFLQSQAMREGKREGNDQEDVP
ncbi:hypothetical protein [Azohydromonas lata]|uniref:hypothetical protein n=1 Tax=Azohydromonas lata TaxID=45677 RepID=UPI0012F49C36|nr:hypothetical protein [Azohydromonas lata]